MVHIGEICGKELLGSLISHPVGRDTQIAYIKGQGESFPGDRIKPEVQAQMFIGAKEGT